MSGVVDRARRFLESEARLLERRIFEGGDVTAALQAYKNPDGGFGEALEPDLRTPDSQPIFVEFALSSLRMSGAEPNGLLDGVADFLDSVATPEGALSPAPTTGRSTGRRPRSSIRPPPSSPTCTTSGSATRGWTARRRGAASASRSTRSRARTR